MASAFNVISVAFDDDDNAYAGLTVLRELDAQDQVEIAEAVVVARSVDGVVTPKDRVDSPRVLGTATGGLLGLIIGIIGGPIGILIGGLGGVAVGSVYDIHDVDETESALSQVAMSVRPGRTALLAELLEQSPEPIDVAMARLGGTVVRRAASDVEAEVAAAEQAEREAKVAALKERVARHAPAHRG